MVSWVGQPSVLNISDLPGLISLYGLYMVPLEKALKKVILGIQRNKCN